MTRARIAAAPVVTLVLCLAGCAQAPALPFRVVSAPPDDPFAFADAIVVAVERDGELDPTTERSFDPAATTFPVRGLSFGERLLVRIEARAGGLVLGRGRSLPFDYRDPSQAPGPGAADVLVGTLGAFVTPIDGSLGSLLVAPSLVVPSPRGAVIVTATTLLEYVAHAPDDGRATLATLAALPPQRHGARWAFTANGLVGAGGASPGATSLTLAGEVLASAGLPPIEALASLAPRPSAIAVATDGSLLRIDVGARGELGLEAVGAAPDLPFDPHLAAVTVLSNGTPRVFALLVDGAHATLIDPDAGPVATHDLGSSRTGWTVAGIATQQALVAGGRDATGSGVVYDDVRILVVQAGTLAEASPAPPHGEAREGAGMIVFGDGLALLVGGRDIAGAAVASAEIIDIAVPPGDVAATRRLPFPSAAPVGAALLDRTLLVAGEGGLAIYVPPRGE